MVFSMERQEFISFCELDLTQKLNLVLEYKIVILNPSYPSEV